MSRNVDGGRELERRVGEAQPAGAEPDLIDGFFARHVAHPLAGPRQRGGGLQHEGGFADAGVTADQHDRGRHEPATEHAVELGNSHDQVPVAAARRPAFQPDERDALAPGFWRRCARSGFDGLLDQRISTRHTHRIGRPISG